MSPWNGSKDFRKYSVHNRCLGSRCISPTTAMILFHRIEINFGCNLNEDRNISSVTDFRWRTIAPSDNQNWVEVTKEFMEIGGKAETSAWLNPCLNFQRNFSHFSPIVCFQWIQIAHNSNAKMVHSTESWKNLSSALCRFVIYRMSSIEPSH